LLLFCKLIGVEFRALFGVPLTKTRRGKELAEIPVSDDSTGHDSFEWRTYAGAWLWGGTSTIGSFLVRAAEKVMVRALWPGESVPRQFENVKFRHLDKTSPSLAGLRFWDLPNIP
jgi:hypothetical protein